MKYFFVFKQKYPWLFPLFLMALIWSSPKELRAQDNSDRLELKIFALSGTTQSTFKRYDATTDSYRTNSGSGFGERTVGKQLPFSAVNHSSPISTIWFGGDISHDFSGTCNEKFRTIEQNWFSENPHDRSQWTFGIGLGSGEVACSATSYTTQKTIDFKITSQVVSAVLDYTFESSVFIGIFGFESINPKATFSESTYKDYYKSVNRYGTGGLILGFAF